MVDKGRFFIEYGIGRVYYSLLPLNSFSSLAISTFFIILLIIFIIIS